MSLVGSLSRSIRLPASLAAWRAGVHRDADIGLGQRRRVVGAIAAHGDQPAFGLLAADQLELALWRGLGKEIVDAGFGSDCRCGQRVVAGDHDGADAHAAQFGEALADAGLDDVLQVDDAEHAAGRARPASGVPPVLAMRSMLRPRAAASPACCTMPSTASAAPLRIDGRLQIGAGHARMRGEGMVSAIRRRRRRRGRASLRASSTIDLPSGVSSARRKQGGATSSRSRDAGDRVEGVGHAVTEGDRAGLVEQQRVDIARRFDGAAGFGNDVGAAPAGPCRRCRSPTTGRRSSSGSASPAGPRGTPPARPHRRRRRRFERRHDEQEDDRHADQQDVERDLVRRLLALGAFDHARSCGRGSSRRVSR